MIIPFRSKNFKIKVYRAVILPILFCGHETWSHTKGRTQIEDIWEQGAEKNIWT